MALALAPRGVIEEEPVLTADHQGPGNDNGKMAACPDGDAGPDAHGNKAEKAATHQKLKLREETNSYFYDGLSLDLLKEYKDLSAAKAEYYDDNGQVIGRKMFGY